MYVWLAEAGIWTAQMVGSYAPRSTERWLPMPFRSILVYEPLNDNTRKVLKFYAPKHQ